jgi:hypothetical protein
MERVYQRQAQMRAEWRWRKHFTHTNPRETLKRLHFTSQSQIVVL